MNANFLRLLMLAGWTYAFMWLLSGERYTLLLAPALWPLLAIGLVFGLLFSTAIFLRSTRHERVHEGGLSQAATFGLLALPLVYLGATANSAGLGSAAFKQRFVGGAGFAQRDTLIGPSRTSGPTASTPGRGEHEPGAMVFTDGAVIPEGQVSLLELFEKYDEYEGREVTFEGMVFRDERVPSGNLVVFRFVVTCCVADAFPLAVMVTHPAAETFETDTWVRVTGQPTKTEFEGADWMKFTTAELEGIDPPERPYLSRF